MRRPLKQTPGLRSEFPWTEALQSRAYRQTLPLEGKISMSEMHPWPFRVNKNRALEPETSGHILCQERPLSAMARHIHRRTGLSKSAALAHCEAWGFEGGADNA